MKMYSIATLQPLSAGDVVFIGRNGEDAQCAAYIDTSLVPSFFPVGTVFFTAEEDTKKSCCTVVQNGYAPSGNGMHAVEGMWVKVAEPIEAGTTLAVTPEKSGLTLAWVTLSDKGARGQREDGSGPLIEKLVREKYELAHSRGFIIPDEEPQLRHLLTDLSLKQQFDLILTTGGTGVAPRDVTPEATLNVIEKRLRGIEQAMMAVSLTKTPNAVISRAVAGTVGNSLIINMPGSTKAVSETLGAVLPALGHTIAKLQGDPADCGN